MKFVGILFLFTILRCKNEPIIYPDGGYAFINTDTIKDKSFPYFPIRDSVDIYDSLAGIFHETTIRTLFNEPNISLEPAKTEIFRLSISGFSIPYYFFTLTDRTIIAKKGLDFEIYSNNKSKLTPLEKFHYEYLSVNSYMIYEKSDSLKKTRRQLYADSLVKIYPELKSVPYFIYLFQKVNYPISKSFKYETRTISLSNDIYKNLIGKINKSGYWKLPLHLECDNGGEATDGYGFSLEANYGKKYNRVGSSYCPNELTDFTQACQQIINYAHYENEITIDYKASQHK
jgi:hypothetical protein